MNKNKTFLAAALVALVREGEKYLGGGARKIEI